MTLEHSHSVSPFDYSALPSDVAMSARDDAEAIRSKGEQIRQSVNEIGERLARQRDALYGRFEAWVEAEFEFSRAHAYRFINFYEAYEKTDLTGHHISNTALMELARKSVDENLRQRMLEAAQKKTVTVEDVKTAIKAAQANREKEVYSLLADAPPVVAHIVGKYGVDSPGTIQALIRLASRNGSDTIQEVLSSGYIQPGHEGQATHITESSAAVESAIRAKALAHRAEAVERKTLGVVHLRGRITVDGDGRIHIDPASSTVFPAGIAHREVIISMRIFDGDNVV